MSRLAAAFDRVKANGHPGLVTYVTAGDPNIEKTADILRAIDRAGATAIEVGVPFSDPLADGPVIRRAGAKKRQSLEVHNPAGAGPVLS